MSSDTAYLYTLGTYLANGGNREDFFDLTPDEVQLVYTVTMAKQEKLTHDILTGLVKILGKMCGGTD